jgi:hypothetical protein
MGLLDEAIREHLELKRRGGADPSAIAREEREALAPVFPEEPAHDEPADVGAAVDAAPYDAPGEEAPEPAPAHAPAPAPAPAAAPAPAPALAPGEPSSEPFAQAALGEETAELDMREAMGEGRVADSGLEPAMGAGDEPALGAFDEIPDEEQREAPPPQLPGQERFGFE